MTVLFLAALACFFAAGGGPALRLSPRAEVLWPWLLIPAASCMFIVVRGLGLVLALSMIAAVAVRKVTSMRAAQAATEAAEATSKMLGSIAGDLRAGATPHDAIVHLIHDAPAPLAELTTIAAHRSASGVTPASAFAEAPDPYRDLRDAGRLWLIADQRGIALAGLLEHMQHRIDARLRHRRATAAALQGPQATALILSALPLAGLAMGTAMGANPWHFLTTTLLGQVMLVIGVLLGCTGFWWVDRIVAAAGGAA